jgi:hypothetical protein
MRRRLVIGAIAAVLIGVAAYGLSQPRKGTVEYHLRELRQIDGVIDAWIRRYGSRAMDDMNRRRQITEWQFHSDALIKLGFLERRLFAVTNNPPDEIATSLWSACARHPDVSWEFGGPEYDETGKVAVLAPPAEMSRWEKLIREADVAASGKR